MVRVRLCMGSRSRSMRERERWDAWQKHRHVVYSTSSRGWTVVVHGAYCRHAALFNIHADHMYIKTRPRKTKIPPDFGSINRSQLVQSTKHRRQIATQPKLTKSPRKHARAKPEIIKIVGNIGKSNASQVEATGQR